MRLLRSVFAIHPASLTCGTLLLIVLIFFTGLPILDLIELQTYDLRILSRGPRQPSPAVVLALVDEKSLDTEGHWPWPRTKIATLVDRLSDDGARVIGFDIGFLEPDENSQLAFLEQFRQQVHTLGIEHPALTGFIDAQKSSANNDLALAQAIKNAAADVVLGYFFHMDTSALGVSLTPQDIDQRFQRLSNSKYPLLVYKDTTVAPVYRAYVPENSLELFMEVAAASGYFSLRSDRDGVIRWMPLIIQGGEDFFPPLSVVCAWHYLGKPPLTVQVDRHGIDGIRMGAQRIPTDENGRLLVNYLGPPRTFPYISISDILHNKLPRGTFTDKIVLVGAIATGTYDMRSTPLSTVFPGAEIHATVIDNILTQNFVTKPAWTKIFDVFAILILGALTGMVLPRIGALKSLGLTIGLFIAYLGMAHWVFVYTGLWLNVVYPLLALMATYTVVTVYRYMTEERERYKVKRTFQHYVTPAVIEEMLKDPSRLKLGGEEKVLTVLFSDLQGFTSHSERYPPHEVIELLNEYYTRMTAQVFVYEGMIEAYTGDEMMAIFGAPIAQSDHAVRACATALAMREQRQILRDEWLKIGRPPLHARTGINSGLMVVGNMGSEYRFFYGAIGDHVNLGSRLEGLNKFYGTEILLGENTAQLVEQSFLLREIDLVRVVGREQAVRVYELLGWADTALPAAQEKAFRNYADGLAAYRQRRWHEACELFAASLALWQSDGPSRTMVERCQRYQQIPPPEDWGGVFEALHK